MKIYTFHTTQMLPIPIEKAWDFFSDPKNLETITPDSMQFKTIAGDPDFGHPDEMGHRNHACRRRQIFCGRATFRALCALAPQAFFQGNSRRHRNGRHCRLQIADGYFGTHGPPVSGEAQTQGNIRIPAQKTQRTFWRIYTLKMTVFWFRRDLRWDDNAGLFHALQHENVLPVFIFDDSILSELPKDDARVTFIHQQLEAMQKQLKKHGKSLATFHGKPLEIYRKLLKENDIKAVYTNHDYEPYARKRDLELSKFFKEHGVEFKTCKDQLIFEKDEVVKDDGSPYVVFTPYSNKWQQNFRKQELVRYPSEKKLDNIVKHQYPFLELSDIGFEKSKIKVPDYDVSANLINHYEATRNFPALDKTSHLGIYLRFGVVSIRKMVEKALKSKNDVFLKELIWREFFMQILWHFPQTVNKSFRPKYDHIRWENNEDFFEKWCTGRTGYPIVDAGMRELNQTGHIHNRVRMVVAGFLCKHLLIDWRWGETYFATKLLDYEQSSNVGNWQWAAGSGVDAAPYFRIFNPAEQEKKFDKDLKYIKKWVPELATDKYPKPIVDHKQAREKCLAVYKKAVG